MIGAGVGALGLAGAFLTKTADVFDSIQKIFAGAQSAKEVIDQLFDDKPDSRLKMAQDIANEIMEKEKLPYFADFNRIEQKGSDVQNVNYQAEFHLVPVSGKLYFERGQYRAEKAAHFVALMVGIASFLEAVQRVKEANVLNEFDIKIVAEVRGVADAEGRGTLLNVAYDGEYGESIAQKGVLSNGRRVNFSIKKGRIYNSELAFLRAYSMAQTLFNAMVKYHINHETLNTVEFVTEEAQKIGKEYRVGIIKLSLSSNESSANA